MNVHEMALYAKSLIRDAQLIDAHFERWLNMAYRQIASDLIIPRLHSGDQVELVQVTDSTNQFYCPYDYQRTISFVDENARSLDPILSKDLRQFGEYNTLGTFVQFYEHASVNITPLYNSFGASVTCTMNNRSLTVTASSAIFTSAHVGEWLLPIDRNSTAGSSNPEDYGYLIASTAGTVAVPSTTCTLARPFRGATSDGGVVGNVTTGYFEIRPRNTPIIRIWGDPGTTDTNITINMEYQRIPSKLANDEDVPEEPRLCAAMVHQAIQSAGWAYQNAFTVKQGEMMIAKALSEFKSSKEFDRELVHNFLVANPMSRSYSMVSGRHMGRGGRFIGSPSIRY